MLWLAAAGFYFYTSPSFQTVAYIASGRGLAPPPVTEVGSVNFTARQPTQSNMDPRIVRWVYVKLPTEISKGKSVQLRVTFAPKKRKAGDEEALARIPIDFNADEEEPEVRVQILAPNFNVDPPSRMILVKLLKDKEVHTEFRVSPRQETPGGMAEIDIQVFYRNQKVGEFTREIKVKDHSIDHLTNRQVVAILFLLAILGGIFNAFQILQEFVAFLRG